MNRLTHSELSETSYVSVAKRIGEHRNQGCTLARIISLIVSEKGHKTLRYIRANFFVFIVMTFTLPSLTHFENRSPATWINPAESLNYIRKEEAQAAEYIRLNSNLREIITLPEPSDCWSVSKNGTYIALSILNESLDFSIRRSSTWEIVLQTTPPGDWHPCSLIWLTDNMFGVASIDAGGGLFYEIVENSLVQLDSPPPQTAHAEDLPEQFLFVDAPEFALASPQPGIFLYQRCVGQIFSDGRQQCPGGIKSVIYDTETASYLAELSRASESISGFNLISQRRSTEGVGAAWSSSGDYIAYHHIPLSIYDNFNLAILDVREKTNINLEYLNESVSFGNGLSWSKTGNKLLFWLRGRAGEDLLTDHDNTTRHPIIYNVNTRNIVAASQPYEFQDDWGVIASEWSPNGDALVFLDGEENLIHFDPQTGITSLVDTNVKRIVSWAKTM